MATGINDHAHSSLTQQQVICEDINRGGWESSHLFFIVFIAIVITACNKKSGSIQRPRDPWAFRSVLDKKPRMLTLALDSECYVAYDLAHCIL